MKKLYLFLPLCFISFALAAQDELDIEGSAVISQSLTAHGINSTNGIEITGSQGLRVTTTNTSVARLQGSNPLVEFHDNTPTYKAFFQSFDDDFYVANRMAGRMYFRTNNLNRMIINGDGNVGIGTISPASKLTINGTESDGTTAGLEILSGSQKTIMDGNEIDCTSGGLHLNYNSLNDLLVRTSEDLGEVTMSHNSGSGAANGVTIEHPGSNNAYWTFYSTNGDGFLELYYQGVQRGEFNSATGAYTTISDSRLKENIRPLGNVLSRVKAMIPSVYQFKHDPQRRDCLGFLAQDVVEQFPELVSRGHIGDTAEELYTMDYSGLGVVAIAAIQELLAEGTFTDQAALLAENQQLKAQVSALEERLAKLEKVVMGQGK